MRRPSPSSAGVRYPSPIPGLQGAGCPQPGLTGPVRQLPNSSPPPSRRSVSAPFPVRGEAPSRASQGARSAGIPGQAHITVRTPSLPPPSPFLTGPLPTLGPPPGAAGDSAGLPLAPQPSRLGAPGPSPGRGGVRRPLLGRLPGSPRSFASDFFRGSFSLPRRREKVFLSSGSAMLGPGPGRVRAQAPATPPPALPALPAPPGPPRPPPAPREQEAHSGNAWPKLFFFFFPIPRPERAMLGYVVARAGWGGDGGSRRPSSLPL